MSGYLGSKYEPHDCWLGRWGMVAVAVVFTALVSITLVKAIEHNAHDNVQREVTE